MVYRFLLFLLREPEGADEIAQETFQVAITKGADPEKGTNYGAWLRSIARNLARNHMRKRRGVRPLLDDGIADTLRVTAPQVARKLTRLPRVVAAAAMLIAALGIGVSFWRSRLDYPRPIAAGDFSVQTPAGIAVSRRGLMRGDRVVAGSGDAKLSLGGYCELVLRPGARLVLRGEEREEAVELEEGTIAARVRPVKANSRSSRRVVAYRS